MRIAFISTMRSFQWGGSEELWSQSATRLKQAGHDVRAAVVYWPQLSEKIAALSRHGLQIETHSPPRGGPTRRIWNKLLFRDRRSYSWLKRFNPELVIISQGYNDDGFDWATICREAAMPYVIIVQCNSDVSWFREQAVSDAVASYTGARRVFCVSRSNLDLLRLQVGDPLLNGEVVWNPYNVSLKSTSPWPDERGGWRLACVARMDPAAKGQDLLLRILARSEWRDLPFELNLFGAGTYELGLRRMARMLRLNNVHFRGHVKDVRTVWEQNHILVLPSRYEGLPLALVEAMACGRPAVVTDVGGNADLCVDNETGFVSPAATVSSFGDALQRAWERRKEWLNMGQAARIRVNNQIPKDPVGVFCERLKSCTNATSVQVLRAESCSL
jgi:glycosyltransferase involved in cell wall biosynthesis